MSKRHSGFFQQRLFEQISMSQKLSRKDREYGEYAGGSFEIARKIAMIDLTLEYKILPEYLTPYLMLYRAWLIKEKKAFFATIGTNEVSQLGLLLGVDTTGKISARKRTFAEPTDK